MIAVGGPGARVASESVSGHQEVFVPRLTNQKCLVLTTAARSTKDFWEMLLNFVFTVTFPQVKKKIGGISVCFCPGVCLPPGKNRKTKGGSAVTEEKEKGHRPVRSLSAEQ